MTKQALRESLIAARLRLSPDERAARSRVLCERILALPPFRAARTIAGYAALGAEADPWPALAVAAHRGARIAFPRLVEGSRRLEFAACAPEALVPGPRATRGPPPDAPAVPLDDLDCILVPGVAFDARGRRLGRGGGYYDATLAALPARVTRVGVAFELQLAGEIPGEPHDADVALIVTESRVLAAGSATH